MQTSARQQELERLYNARRGHVPHISISDDSHHITEAIGSYYGSETTPETSGLGIKPDNRPLSYMSGPSEARFTAMPRSTSLSNRHATHLDTMERPTMPMRRSSEKVLTASPTSDTNGSPTGLKRLSSLTIEDMNGAASSSSSPSRHNSTDTPLQSFPLNDIDYESSPAAVAQELSNLQAIRRMSMNVDMADPDLPSFGGLGNVPTVAPGHSTSEDDPSKLFWVPARLHPELAPKEFKTFVEERVDKIRRRSGSGSEDSLSPDSLERSNSGDGLRRKKSMLSHQIDARGNYEDGAERLERKRSKGMRIEGATTIANLHDLEELVNDPAQLVRRMSLDTQQRRSEDSGSDVPVGEDVILPGLQQTLKRSTRTTYRRGSLRKGERVPFSKRALGRQTDSETEDGGRQSQDDMDNFELPILGLTRVQTEPIPEPLSFHDNTYIEPSTTSLHLSTSHDESRASNETSYVVPDSQQRQQTYQSEQYQQRQQQQQQQQQQQVPTQPKQFQSRIASQGRTTAQLPGYNNTNPLPHVIETLPDGSKGPLNTLQSFPERKSSIEVARAQRGGAHSRPVPGRQQPAPATTLNDISSNPSPLPGSGGTRTDALTLVPTYEEKRVEKKETGRKSSWKWILGNDDDDKKSNKKSDDISSLKSSKSHKLSKAERARLDIQHNIDANANARPRESLVLNREDIKLEDDRKAQSKKSFDISRKEKEPKESGLLSAIFGSKKKTSSEDVKEKKKKHDRLLSPEPPPRLLKADIDYNWTRFSILEERAIYRLAHLKLANPRRALYSQVLLSNFMYSYLAKVQMMHPQMQVPQQGKNQEQQRQHHQQQQQQQRKKESQPSEYQEYNRWPEQQSSQQQADAQSQPLDHAETIYKQDDLEYEPQIQQSEWPDYHQDTSHYKDHTAHNNGAVREPGGQYSVASGHDYLGYPKEQQNHSDHMWEDEDSEDLW